MLFTGFAIFAVIAPVFILSPQIHRLLHVRSDVGISVKALKLGIASSAGWLTYGISSKLWVIYVANAVGISLLIWIAFLVLRVGTQLSTKSFFGTCVLMPLFCGVALLSIDSHSEISIGLLCSLFSIIGPFMQVVRVFKDLNLFGLSAPTYGNAIIIHSGWFTYGLSISDPYVIFPNLYGFSIASLILFRIVKSRRSLEILKPS